MAKAQLQVDIVGRLNDAQVRGEAARMRVVLESAASVELADPADLKRLADGFDDLVDAAGAFGDAVDGIDTKPLMDSLSRIDPEKIRKLADSWELTKKSLSDTVRQQQAALAEMRRTGDTGSEAYREVEASVAEARAELEKMLEIEKEVADVADESAGVFQKMFAFEAIGKAGEFLSSIEEKTSENADAMRTLQARTGATGDELTRLGGIANDVFARGFPGSIAEATTALARSKQLLGQFLDEKGLADFTLKAGAIGKRFDTDVNDVIGKGRTIVAQWGLEGGEAGDLIALAMQKAGSGQDDAMDTLDEYSQHFKNLGFSAQESIGLLTRGIEAGTRDTDKLADAVKETGIRLKAGDVQNALKGIDSPITDQIQKIVQLGESGALSVKDVLQQVTSTTETAFKDGQISEQIRAQFQTALSGSPAEDIGTEIYAKVFSAPIDGAAIAQQATAAGKIITDSIKPQNVFEAASREAEVFASNVASFFSPVISGAGGILTTVTQIGPGLTLLQDKFKIFDVAGGLVKKLIASVLGTVPALGAQAVATEGATVAQVGLNTAQYAMPILAVVGGIAAIVAAFALFGDSTKEIGQAIDDVNSALDDFGAAQDRAVQTRQASKDLHALADEYDRLAEKPARTAAEQKRFIEVSDELASKAPDYAEAVETIGAKGEITGQQMRIATDGVRAFADENQRLADEAAADQMESLQSEAAALVESYRDSSANLGEMKQKRIDMAAAAKGEYAGLVQVHDTIAETLPFVETSREQQAALNKDIAEESKKRIEAQTTIKKAVDSMQKAGLSQAEIAEKLGLTNDEVKKFVPAMTKSGSAIQDAARQALGLQANTQRATSSAENLAAAWNKAKQAIDAAYSNQFGAVLQLREEQRKSQRELAGLTGEGLNADQIKRKAYLEQRLRDIPNEIAAELQATRDALKEKRRLADEELKLKIEVGEIDVKRENLLPQAREIRRQIDEIMLGIVDVDLEGEIAKRKAEIDLELQGKLDKAQQDLNTLNARITADAKDRTTDLTGKNELRKALIDLPAALRKEADAEKLRAEKEIREKLLAQFREGLAREQAALDESIQARIASLEAEAAAIKGVDDDALSDRLSKRLQIIELGTAKELQAVVNGNERYLDTYAKLQQALSEVNKATTDEQRRTAQSHADALRRELGVIQADILATDAKALGIQQQQQIEVAAATDEILDARYQRELKKLQDAQSRELAVLERRAEKEKRLIDDLAQFASDFGQAGVESDAARKLRELDELHQKLLLSDSDYAAQKADIERRSAEDRAAVESRVTGARLEAERMAALQSLALQREQTRARLTEAQKAGRAEDVAALTEQLDGIERELQDKSGALTGIAGELQSNLTSTLTNLFTGEEGAVREPFKRAFNVMAGGLQTMASAKISEVLLSTIGPTGIVGLIASVALRPLVSAIIASVMGPALNSLLSFSTGGRVDQPTLAVVGDASRLGGSIDREWILRDDQMKMLVGQVLGAFSGSLGAKLDRIALSLDSYSGRIHVLQQDVSEATRRQRAANRRRVRGR